MVWLMGEKQSNAGEHPWGRVQPALCKTLLSGEFFTSTPVHAAIRKPPFLFKNSSFSGSY